jgi:hypothetical protein
MGKYRNIIAINNRSLKLLNISHMYHTNHIPVNLKFKTEPCCHLQFPRTVTVYSFTSNNMILFKTLSTASIKSTVLEPHSGSVIGRREGYLHKSTMTADTATHIQKPIHNNCTRKTNYSNKISNKGLSSQ